MTCSFLSLARRSAVERQDDRLVHFPVELEFCSLGEGLPAALVSDAAELSREGQRHRQDVGLEADRVAAARRGYGDLGVHANEHDGSAVLPPVRDLMAERL